MRPLSPLLLAAALQAQGGVFAEPQRIELEGLELGAIAHADVDGDGRRDLLLGTRRLWLHRNEGTDDRPRWAARVELFPGGRQLPVPEG